MATSLYERLGGEQGIRNLASDLVDLHLKNPLINARFQKTDVKRLKQLAFEFVCMGTGGPQPYTGKDIRSAHAGMNISEQELLAVMDDAEAALDKNGVGPLEKAEFLTALFSLRREVIRV